MITNIYINGRLLDLFDDEKVELTSKLSDVEKLSNVFNDFSNSFTVPATANNNQIFKHYYDVDIDDSFNANIAVDSIIEIDSFTLRQGKIQLEGVNVLEGKPDSYKIAFFGGLKQLSELFKNDKLSRLDYVVNEFGVESKVYNSLSQFDFIYNSTNYINSLNLPTFMGGNIITPLINYSDRDWNYGDDGIYDIGIPKGAIKESETRFAIKVIKIIEAIEEKYNIEFSRDFFGRAMFNDLFLWMNNEKDRTFTEDKIVDIISNGNFNDVYYTVNTVSNTILKQPAPLDVEKKLIAVVKTTSGYEDVNLRFKMFNVNGVLLQTQEGVGVASISYSGNDEVYFTVSSDITAIYQVTFTASNFSWNFAGSGAPTPIRNSRIMTTNSISSNNVFQVENAIPDMQVLEFIQGIMKAFKLVIRPLATDRFYIDTLNEYYKKGKVIDITDYTDQKEVNIDRPIVYRNIGFYFQKTDNVLGKKFRELNDPINELVGYGDLSAEYNDIISKDTLKIELPFENMLFERMTISYPHSDEGTLLNFMTGSSVSVDDEGVVSKNSSKPILFFNNGITNSNPYPIYVNFGGSIGTVIYTYLIGNTNDEYIEQVTNSINFGAEVDPWHQDVVYQGLYNEFWKDWVETIYSLKQRKFSFNAVLPPRVIDEISLNDRFIIGSNRYKINDYKTDLTTGETKLNLFNDIYSFNPTPPVVNRNSIVANAGGKNYEVVIKTNSTWTVSKIDTGDGTSWVSTDVIDGIGDKYLRVKVQEKASQAPPAVYTKREMQLKITVDTIEYIINVTQYGLE